MGKAINLPYPAPLSERKRGFPVTTPNQMNTAAVKMNTYIITMRSLAQARMDGNKVNEANALFIIRRLGYVQN